MADNVVYIKAELKFVNRKSLRAIRRIAELADEIASDLPWRDDAREMKRAAKYVLKTVAVELSRE